MRSISSALLASTAIALGACADATAPVTPGGADQSSGTTIASGDYVRLDLGPGFGEDVNDARQVLINGVAGEAFLWSPGVGHARIGEFTGFAVNGLGEVAGSAMLAGASHAVVWTPAAGMRDLGSLAADPVSYGAWAADINDRGEVTGATPVAPDDCYRVFRWTAAGGMRAISTGGSRTCEEYGVGINNAGMILGQFGHVQRFYVSRIWRASSGWTTVATGLNEFVGTVPSEINEQGDVVGTRVYFGANPYPFFWRFGRAPVPLDIPRDAFGEARGMNDAGAVVGWTAATGGYIWTRTGGTQALEGGVPNAINEEGIVVGTSFDTGEPRVVLWLPRASTDVVAMRAPVAAAASAGAAPGSLPRAASVRECEVDGRVVPVPCAAARRLGE
jgi:hypothetical protein